MPKPKEWRNPADAVGRSVTTASTPLESSQHHGTCPYEQGGRRFGDDGKGGAFIGKSSASLAPGGEGDRHIYVFSGQMQDRRLSHHSRRETGVPSLPGGISQRSIVGETAVSPFGSCGADKTSVTALLFGVEESLSRAARQPDTGCDTVLVGGLGSVGSAQLAKADDGAVPNCRGLRGGCGGSQNRERRGTNYGSEV